MSDYYKNIELASAGSMKTIVSIPAWAQALHEGEGGQRDTINTAAQAYAYVPLIFRAVRLVCNSLVAAPVRFYKGTKEVGNPLKGVSIDDLLWKSQAAMSLVGANYLEKIPLVKSGKVGSLKWVNPTTMTVRLNHGVLEFQQGSKTAGTPGATFTLDNMVYMREFTLREDIGPGDSSAKVSLNDAALLRYMSRFAARFFEKGAMPYTLLQIDGIVDKDEAQRIEGWFKRVSTGLRNAFNVMALGRQIEPKVISQPVKDLVIPELAQQARRSVADAFDFHPSLLDEAPNMATAQEHRLSLYEDSVKPRAKILVNEFNRQLFEPMGIEMKICFDEMDIFQEDENEKAASVKALTEAIAADPEIAMVVMDVMGYDLEEKEKSALAAIVADRKKKPEEPKQPPPPQGVPPAEQAPVVQQPETPAKVAWADDVARWERKALRVFKESGSAVCEYVSDVLPGEIHSAIDAGLATCKTAEDVRRLFDVEADKPTTPEHNESALKELAMSINALAAEYSKSLTITPAPQPITNITFPPITMTAQLPEQKEPSVTFSPVIQAAAAKEPTVIFSPVIQPSEVAIQNKNDITVQPADVKIDMPKPKRERQKVKRGKNGFIESTDTSIEYE